MLFYTAVYFNLAYCLPHFAAISSSVNLFVFARNNSALSSTLIFICSPIGTKHRARCM